MSKACTWVVIHMDGLGQDGSNSNANALELLQSCTKPLICAKQTSMFRLINKPLNFIKLCSMWDFIVDVVCDIGCILWCWQPEGLYMPCMFLCYQFIVDWSESEVILGRRLLFANFSVTKIFNLVEVPVRFFESHSYLSGVTAAQLHWHVSNINGIFIS